ncbi:MAG TPA: antibiotic biosynthesis monooxygenase [Anaerolineae bacterium]|nr:antibiotic biosynthesis monooxygenase [Anaerolineae bacterium]
MIARIWHGITPAAKADAYLDFLNQSGVPDYQATPGNRGVYVLRRIEGDVAHFTLISLWDSMEAIKQFAGPEPEQARYYPEDKDFLLEFEPTVTHHEVFVQP